MINIGSYDDPINQPQVHNTDYNISSLKFTVSLPDYFEPGCRRQYLSFFENHESRFHYIDLEELLNSSRASFHTVELRFGSCRYLFCILTLGFRGCSFPFSRSFRSLFRRCSGLTLRSWFRG